MNYLLLWKSVEQSADDRWTRVADIDSLEKVDDELASWQGPSLSHGDLVMVGGARQSVQALYVFDAEAVAFAKAPKVPGKDDYGWVDFWHVSIALSAMMRTATRVDRRRLILAAADCVELALDRLESTERPLAERSLEEARRWVACGGSTIPAQRYGFAVARAGNELPVGDASYVCEAASLVADGTYSRDYRQILSEAVDSASMLVDDKRRLREIILKYVPLSVVLCAKLGLKDPLPLQRDNPRRRPVVGA